MLGLSDRGWDGGPADDDGMPGNCALRRNPLEAAVVRKSKATTKRSRCTERGLETQGGRDRFEDEIQAGTRADCEALN